MDVPLFPISGGQASDNLWGRVAEIRYANVPTERFTYTKWGQITKKTLIATGGIELSASYTYQSTGTVDSITYPTHWEPQGGSYVETTGTKLFMYYDWARRPQRMNKPNAFTVAINFAYNSADQMTSMQALPSLAGGTMYTETRQYNAYGQLTRQTVAGEVDIEYRFSPTVLDGRLEQRKDWISGEEVTYQYDQLGRLIAAATTGPEWGQSYGFDGFGNLTQQVVTKGTAPSMSMVVDPATNRLGGSGVSYDAVGNLTSDGVNTFTYDGHNRLRTAAGETYTYSSKNQRLVVTRPDGTKDFHLYGAFGELLGVYNVISNPGGGGLIAVRQASKERVYLGGRLMYLGGEKVVSDRLGSVVRHGTASYRYYPYGQEFGGATTNDKPKFGTYTRDASTGLDYAWNRYYQAGWGRFTSPDEGPPLQEETQSWNRYSYTWGDPINLNDPDGRLPAAPGFLPGGGSGRGYGVPDWYYEGSGSFVIGGNSPTISSLYQVAMAVTALEEVADWVIPSTTGRGYDVAISPALFAEAFMPQLAGVGTAGTILIGTTPVGWTIAAGGAIILTGIWLHQTGILNKVLQKAKDEFDDMESIRRQCEEIAHARADRLGYGRYGPEWIKHFSECVRTRVWTK